MPVSHKNSNQVSQKCNGRTGCNRLSSGNRTFNISFFGEFREGHFCPLKWRTCSMQLKLEYFSEDHFHNLWGSHHELGSDLFRKIRFLPLFYHHYNTGRWSPKEGLHLSEKRSLVWNKRQGCAGTAGDISALAAKAGEVPAGTIMREVMIGGREAETVTTAVSVVINKQLTQLRPIWFHNIKIRTPNPYGAFTMYQPWAVCHGFSHLIFTTALGGNNCLSSYFTGEETKAKRA